MFSIFDFVHRGTWLVLRASCGLGPVPPYTLRAPAPLTVRCVNSGRMGVACVSVSGGGENSWLSARTFVGHFGANRNLAPIFPSSFFDWIKFRNLSSAALRYCFLCDPLECYTFAAASRPTSCAARLLATARRLPCTLDAIGSKWSCRCATTATVSPKPVRYATPNTIVRAS